MEIFENVEDYSFFMTKIEKYKKEYGVEIIVYCLMPNHFHFLVREPIYYRKKPFGSKIAQFFHSLQTSYSVYYNHRHRSHSGHVFQGKYNSKKVTNSDYLLTLIAYILNNPVRKNFVKKYHEWPYRSALGAKDGLEYM